MIFQVCISSLDVLKQVSLVVYDGSGFLERVFVQVHILQCLFWFSGKACNVTPFFFLGGMIFI